MARSPKPSGHASVDAVLLDAGGVLLLPHHDTMRTRLAAFGRSATDAELTRAHYLGMAALDAHPEHDWSAYREAVASACGVPAEELAATQQAWAANPCEWTSPTAGVVELLRALADHGVALAVVSNAAGRVEKQLGEAGVCQVGEGLGVPVVAVIDSHVVGVEKPDPGIFSLALDAVGVPAERAIMVGDYAYADVRGAEAAGIRAFHLDPYGDCRTPHDGPDVDRLGAVVDVIRR
ncbi:MAG: HAD family hydrolase [Acidothermales bacterium]|nr:HAD family hydrolase [Acidothermales bacterium]